MRNYNIVSITQLMKFSCVNAHGYFLFKDSLQISRNIHVFVKHCLMKRSKTDCIYIYVYSISLETRSKMCATVMCMCRKCNKWQAIFFYFSNSLKLRSIDSNKMLQRVLKINFFFWFAYRAIVILLLENTRFAKYIQILVITCSHLLKHYLQNSSNF